MVVDSLVCPRGHGCGFGPCRGREHSGLLEFSGPMDMQARQGQAGVRLYFKENAIPCSGCPAGLF
jgi:hypothetical protein